MPSANSPKASTPQAPAVPWTLTAPTGSSMRSTRSTNRQLQTVGTPATAPISTAAQELTWDATAARLLEVYRATLAAPPRPRAGGGPPLAEDAVRLVGPGGELPEDLYRPLLALATHRRIAGPVFGAIKLGYRFSYRLGRHRRK